MNDDQSIKSEFVSYIETPRQIKTPEKIDVLLEKRMKEFVLERRRRIWRQSGNFSARRADK